MSRLGVSVVGWNKRELTNLGKSGTSNYKTRVHLQGLGISGETPIRSTGGWGQEQNELKSSVSKNLNHRGTLETRYRMKNESQ